MPETPPSGPARAREHCLCDFRRVIRIHHHHGVCALACDEQLAAVRR